MMGMTSIISIGKGAVTLALMNAKGDGDGVGDGD